MMMGRVIAQSSHFVFVAVVLLAWAVVSELEVEAVGLGGQGLRLRVECLVSWP